MAAWHYWTGSATTTATCSTGTVWYDWCGNSTSTTATCTSGTWISWVTTTSTWSGTTGSVQNQSVKPYRQSPQEAAAARRREEEYRERQKDEAERYQKAKDRAEGLLYEHLSDEQRAAMKRDKFFVVVGGKTGRRYKINAQGGLSGNVHEVDAAGVLQRRLCAHIEHAANAPIYDHLLAQKLMLEYQEESFLKVANDHGR